MEESAPIFLSALTILFVAKAAWRTGFWTEPRTGWTNYSGLDNVSNSNSRAKKKKNSSLRRKKKKPECPLAVITIISCQRLQNSPVMFFTAVCGKSKHCETQFFSVWLWFFFPAAAQCVSWRRDAFGEHLYMKCHLCFSRRPQKQLKALPKNKQNKKNGTLKGTSFHVTIYAPGTVGTCCKI